MRTSGAMLICNEINALHRKGLGKKSVGLSTPRAKLRSGAEQNELAVDQVLANFVAELFATLHPATLPMLMRMFEDVKQDAGPMANGSSNAARRLASQQQALRLGNKKQSRTNKASISPRTAPARRGPGGRTVRTAAVAVRSTEL